MSRRDVLFHMAERPKEWFTIDDIEKEMGIGHNTANKHLIKLSGEGYLERLYQCGQSKRTYYRFKKMDKE